MILNKNKNIEAIIKNISKLNRQDSQLGSLNKDIKNLLSSLCTRLKSGRDKLISIFEDIFNEAFQVSSFDLKLSFFGEHTRNISKKITLTSSSVNSTAENTLKSISEITKANAELASSIESISSKANLLSKNTTENQQMVEKISTAAENTLNNSEMMKENFGFLVSSLNNMKKIVDGINEISDQTNLLALNASIEAARAGESGKGFSVVADEIRKLSENTKQLLSNMYNIVNDITANSTKSMESINQTADSMKNISESVEAVFTSAVSSNQAIHEIASSLENIAAANQQINASLQEVTASMSVLKDHSEDLKENAEGLESIGKNMDALSDSIEKLEFSLDKTAKKCGEIIHDKFYILPNEKFIDFIQSVINNHKKWLASLETMTETKAIKPVQTDHKKCSFGHFYYSVCPSHPEIIEVWNKVEELHSNFHSSGEKVIEAIRNNDTEAASKALKVSKEMSEKMSVLLTELIDRTKVLTSRNETVF